MKNIGKNSMIRYAKAILKKSFLKLFLYFGITIFGVNVYAATMDAHWPFDGNSTDDAVNTHDLVAGTVTYSTQSARGTATAYFDGSTNYLRYSDGTFLNQAITYFSYAFWVKPTDLTGIQQLLDEGGNVNGLAIRLNDNVLECAVQESNSIKRTDDFTFPDDGLWHHIAVTYNNGDVILYLDGEPSTVLATGFAQLKKHSSAHAFARNKKDAFDNLSGTDYFQGFMDDIRHYADATESGSVLTQAEINDLLGCGAPGTAQFDLTAFQWRVISFPCSTGLNTIEDLLGTSLGIYGDENSWVMYQQNDTTYTGNPSTDMTVMNSTDIVVPGKGYWIIADADKNATIDTELSGLSRTAVESAGTFSGVNGGTVFYDVLGYDLPDSNTSHWKKVMIGNPFTKKFQLSDLFFANGVDDFVSMVDVNINDYIESVVYAHDNASLDPSDYIAITAVTPGFTDEIVPMLGFWIKLNLGNSNTNKITYPYETLRR